MYPFNLQIREQLYNVMALSLVNSRVELSIWLLDILVFSLWNAFSCPFSPATIFIADIQEFLQIFYQLRMLQIHSCHFLANFVCGSLTEHKS